jgi:parallel beta-helix repeat protein
LFKKNSRIAIFVALAVFVMSSASWGAKYYVDATNGNDGNDGRSPEKAWGSIAKVNVSHFLPGDVILFKRGEIWRETLTPRRSGTRENSIIFGAYGMGNVPVISGADDITGPDFKWELSRKGTHEYYLVALGGGAPGMKEPNLVWVNGRKVEKEFAGFLHNHGWDWFDNDNLGFKTIYVRDNSGDPDETGVLIEVAQRNSVVHCKDLSHVTFENLEIRQGNGAWNGVFDIRNSSFITIRNCSIHSGNYAVLYIYHENGPASCRSNTVESSTIYGCYRDPSKDGAVIKLDKTDYNIIKNSKIYRSNNKTTSDVITVWESDHNIIEQNEIYGPAYNGIYVRPNADSNIIRYNSIHHITSDGIQVRENSHHNEIYYNVFYENGLGLFVRGYPKACSGTRILNNTFYSTAPDFNGIIIVSRVANTMVTNNIIFVGTALALLVDSQALKGVALDSNCYRNAKGPLIKWGGIDYQINQFAEYQSASGQDSNSITDDPDFVDPGKKNFRLKSSSPCIDTGKNMGLVKDFDGNPVPQGYSTDIGAFEHRLQSGILPPK